MNSQRVLKWNRHLRSTPCELSSKTTCIVGRCLWFKEKAVDIVIGEAHTSMIYWLFWLAIWLNIRLLSYFRCGKNSSGNQSSSYLSTGFSWPPCHPASDVEPGGGPEPSALRTISEPTAEFGSTFHRSTTEQYVDRQDSEENVFTGR